MCKFVGTNSNFLSAFKLLALNEGPKKQNIQKQRASTRICTHERQQKGALRGHCSESRYGRSQPWQLCVAQERISLPDAKGGQPAGRETGSGGFGGEWRREAASGGTVDACPPMTPLFTKRLTQEEALCYRKPAAL